MGPWAYKPMGPWVHRPMGPWAHGPIGPWAHGPIQDVLTLFSYEFHYGVMGLQGVLYFSSFYISRRTVLEGVAESAQRNFEFRNLTFRNGMVQPTRKLYTSQIYAP